MENDNSNVIYDPNKQVVRGIILSYQIIKWNRGKDAPSEFAPDMTVIFDGAAKHFGIRQIAKTDAATGLTTHFGDVVKAVEAAQMNLTFGASKDQPDWLPETLPVPFIAAINPFLVANARRANDPPRMIVDAAEIAIGDGSVLEFRGERIRVDGEVLGKVKVPEKPPAGK